MNTGSITIASKTSHAKISGDVAGQLLMHLNDEEATLKAMVQAVRGVHSALKELKENDLRQWLEFEEIVLQAAEGMKQRRNELRHLLSHVLNIAPEDVTLSGIMASTEGSVRLKVERVRKALSEMSAEMNRLNQQNAAMVRQSSELTQNIIRRLTGVSPAGGSYNAHGGLDVPPPKSLVKWGG